MCHMAIANWHVGNNVEAVHFLGLILHPNLIEQIIERKKLIVYTLTKLSMS